MMGKRLFDLIFVVPGLLLLSPAFVLIALWIKIDSRGPVFFRQVRVGQHGIPFRIYKFRTMVVDAEAKGLRITVGGDPRITQSGRFLRKYKLDELPQLINVLVGEMSLVGPRPEVPEYVACYSASDRAKVLSVCPGITDNASIEFSDEGCVLEQAVDPHQAYVSTILPIKLAHYRRYVDEQSLLGDFRLIVRTIRKILM